jgi:predicted regulator of Ras-like GTPase activity (Roadblock/LC7/MglB family)
MLDEVVNGALEATDGAVAVLLFDKDGMIVARRGPAEGPSWELIAASWTDLLRRVEAANREAGREPPTELIMVSAGFTLVMRPVASGYALALALGPEGIVGRARYELAKAAERLRPELVGL